MATRLTVFFILFLLFLAPKAHAGFVEVGVSGSYKRSNIDVDSYDESQSYTGSLSYYFDESSALELSYTDGSSTRIIGQNQTTGHNTVLTYKNAGLDFIWTIGARDAVIRPYIKIGAVYIFEKKIVDQYRDQSGVWTPTPIEDPPALVPSAGLGFKLSLTQSLSLKVGAEAWTSRPVSQQPVTVDVAGRVGLAWMF